MEQDPSKPNFAQGRMETGRGHSSKTISDLEAFLLKNEKDLSDLEQLVADLIELNDVSRDQVKTLRDIRAHGEIEEAIRNREALIASINIRIAELRLIVKQESGNLIKLKWEFDQAAKDIFSGKRKR